MPKEFLNAIAHGGKVRTKKLSGGKYIHIVLYKGKWYKGEVKKKKK